MGLIGLPNIPMGPGTPTPGGGGGGGGPYVANVPNAPAPPPRERVQQASDGQSNQRLQAMGFTPAQIKHVLNFEGMTPETLEKLGRIAQIGGSNQVKATEFIEILDSKLYNQILRLGSQYDGTNIGRLQQAFNGFAEQYKGLDPADKAGGHERNSGLTPEENAQLRAERDAERDRQIRMDRATQYQAENIPVTSYDDNPRNAKVISDKAAAEAGTPYGGPNHWEFGRDLYGDLISPQTDALSAQQLAAARANLDATLGFSDEVRGSKGYNDNLYLMDEMQNLYESGGLTDKTREQLENNRRMANQLSIAHQNSASQDFAERGMGGGTAEFEARMSGVQDAAQRQQIADLGAAAFGQESAVNALKDFGTAADNQYERDYDLYDSDLAGRTTYNDAVLDANTLYDREVLGFTRDFLGPSVMEQIDNTFNQPGQLAGGAGGTIDKVTDETNQGKGVTAGAVSADDPTFNISPTGATITTQDTPDPLGPGQGKGEFWWGVHEGGMDGATGKIEDAGRVIGGMYTGGAVGGAGGGRRRNPESG